jgi:hypothetical protein
MSDNNSSQLTAAAEALVRAAVSKMNASVVAMDCEVVQGIQSIAADLKGRNDDKMLEVLNGKVDTLNSNISQMHVTMKIQEKLHRIDFALGHCSLGTLSYFTYGSCYPNRGEQLVRAILLEFRKGSGYYITLNMVHDPHCSSNEAKLTSNQQFRDALTAELFTLLGVEPVWDAVSEEDGRRAIRYP